MELLVPIVLPVLVDYFELAEEVDEERLSVVNAEGARLVEHSVGIQARGIDRDDDELLEDCPRLPDRTGLVGVDSLGTKHVAKGALPVCDRDAFNHFWILTGRY